LTGYFNSNKIWDEKERVGNHSPLTLELITKPKLEKFKDSFSEFLTNSLENAKDWLIIGL